MNNHTRALLQPAALMTYIAAFAIGALYAQILPTLSVYMVQRFNSSPFQLGVFFVAIAASAIAVSQVIGRLSDKGINRLILVFLGMLAGCVSCISYALSESALAATLTGIFIFSFSAITLPQVMAHGREFADANLAKKQVALFNAILRASFALAWIGGPPLGFYLQHQLGTEKHYLFLGCAYLLVGTACWFLLPKAPPKVKDSSNSKKPFRIPFNLKLGFLACALLFGVNHSYMIALPHLLQGHLNISTQYTGLIMGAAAALEIPIMLAGGALAARMPLLPLLRIGAAAAAALYIGVWSANALWQLIALQIFNAIFVGFIAGLGMTWFQDQMPKAAGTASSLFSNAIQLGNILGSLIIGFFAAWLGYHHMYLINALAAVLAVGLFFVCASEQRS